MKTKLLLLSLFIFCLNFSFAQTYESVFGDDSTSWSVWYAIVDGGGTSPYKTIGEETINGKVYQKVDFDWHWLPLFLREDRDDGKVWMLDTDSVEYLVVDMSLVVGDSFLLQIGPFSPEYVTVKNVYYQGGLKHIVFDRITFGICNNAPLTFIEGIGPNISLFYPEYTGGFAACLYCKNKDGQQVYTWPGYTGTCNVQSVGIDEKIEYNTFISISPHPLTDHSVIDFESYKGQSCQLYLYDLTGKNIYESPRTREGQISLQKNQLQSGLYFLTIKTEEGIVGTQKLMVR